MSGPYVIEVTLRVRDERDLDRGRDYIARRGGLIVLGDCYEALRYTTAADAAEWAAIYRQGWVGISGEVRVASEPLPSLEDAIEAQPPAPRAGWLRRLLARFRR